MSKTTKLLCGIISVACLALSTNIYAAKGSGGGTTPPPPAGTK